MYAATAHTAVFVGPWRGAGRVQRLLTVKSERREGMHLSGKDAVMTLAWHDKQHALLRDLIADRSNSPALSPACCWIPLRLMRSSLALCPLCAVGLGNRDSLGLGRDQTGIFLMPKVPDLIGIDDVSAYRCINDYLSFYDDYKGWRNGGILGRV